MITKINALIMAIYLFFAGFIYGDEPIKVEFDCEFSNCEFSCPEEFGLRVTVKGKNVGRPFEGEDPYYADVSIYREVDGKKEYLHQTLGAVNDGLPKPILIKHGDEFKISSISSFWYADGYDFDPEDLSGAIEPGVYSVQVWVYGCKRVYENIITIGSGEEA